MKETSESAYERICRDLLSVSEPVLQWKWDARFDAVLTEFTLDNQEIIQSILENHLPHVWDKSSLDQAPASVQKISTRFGGLMSRQLFFTSAQDADFTILCAWWPWGDGNTISIRLALSYAEPNDSQKSQMIQLSKSCFNL